MKTLLCCLSLLCLPALAEAEAWYQVEVIIFDRLTPDAGGEQWRDTPFILPDDPVNPRAVEALAEVPAEAPVEVPAEAPVEVPAEAPAETMQPAPYRLLPPARHRLGGIYNVLRREAEYQPLLHLSWQQPAATGGQARHVRLRHPAPDGATAPATEEPMFIEQLIRPAPEIDGAIRIRAGFYLHADIDLSRFRVIPPANTIPPAPPVYETAGPEATQKTRLELKETRRIKLNEIHYFDHPMYGVILQVSRLNPAAE